MPLHTGVMWEYSWQAALSLIGYSRFTRDAVETVVSVTMLAFISNGLILLLEVCRITKINRGIILAEYSRMIAFAQTVYKLLDLSSR